MKLALVLLAALALTASASSRRSGDRSNEEESGRRNRHHKLRRDGQLDDTEMCVLCRETWREALGSFNAFNTAVRDGDGVITAEKTCRRMCTPKAVTKMEEMDEEALDSTLCTACRVAIDFWREQPSKKPHYQLAKTRMCGQFREERVRDDCEHTVRMYGFDTFAAIRNDVSSSSICHMYNLCGRQPLQDMQWDSQEDDQEVSLDELLKPLRSSESNNQSNEGDDEEKKSTEKSKSREENSRNRSEQRRTESSEERQRRREERREERRNRRA